MRPSLRQRLSTQPSTVRAIALAAALLASVGTASAASFTWVGPNNGFWDALGNWNPVALPGGTADVALGAFDTELRSGSFSINALAGTGRLTLSGGSLALATASSIGAWAQTGGSLSGAGALTVAGASTWMTGGMTGTGSTTFNGALSISSNGSHDITSRSVNFAGISTWTNAAGGSVGRIITGSGATLTNSGSFLDQTSVNSQIYNGFGGPASSFVNTGSFIKSGASTTDIGMLFNNSGTTTVNAGTLSLSAGGSSNGGTFDVASGATLNFGGGTHALANVLAGSGTGRTQVSGGTVNATGASAFNGALGVSGGTFNANGTVTAAGFDMTAGTIGGTGSLVIGGAASWTNGGMTGTGSTTFNGALAISGNGSHDITSRSVNFAGISTWTNAAGGSVGRIITGSGATLTNSGSFLDQTSVNSQIYNGFGGPASAFVNTGAFTKSGASSTDIGLAFSNSGTTTVSAGTLNLGGGGISSGGTFDVASGATLNFSGGTHTLANITAGTGTGRMLVSGGTVNSSGTLAFGGTLGASGGVFNANGTATAAGFEMTAGTIGGSGSLVIGGTASWTNGGMTGTGSTTFNGPLAISSNGSHDITSRSVNFAGTSTWTNAAGGSVGRIITGSGATLTNSGSFLDQTSVNSQIYNGFGGPASAFVNTGTFTKSGASTTEITMAFNNSGVVNGGGTGFLILSGGGTHTGSFAMDAGSTVQLNGGTHTFSGSSTGAGGRILLSSGTATTATAMTTTTRWDINGGTVSGAGAFNLNGEANWISGAMIGSGSTTFGGALAISSNGSHEITSRSVNFAGTSTWTNAAGGGVGRIITGSGATLTNSGSFLDQTSVNSQVFNGFGGAASAFVNTGSYTKSGSSTTDIALAFTNSGTVAVTGGILGLNSTLSNFASNTLTGGTFSVGANSTLNIASANIINNAASIMLDGVGSLIRNVAGNNDALTNFASNRAAGSFAISNGRNFTSLANFSNAGALSVGAGSTFKAGGQFTNQLGGTVVLAGGTLSDGFIGNNDGSLSGFGAVTTNLSNSGSVRASGGSLSLARGAAGTGSLSADAGASLAVGGPFDSSAGLLSLGGGSLSLGSRNLIISGDYSNTAFGSGNAFDRRANVSGSGLILAAGTTQQTLAGALLTGGNTAAATLALPNIRVGLGGVTTTFAINNVGSGGPSLRGALQDSGITNVALSGSGVTAQNWGALAQGASSGAYSVSFNPSFGQALSGQSVVIVNNFDNVAAQTLAITGAAFNLASASAAAPAPVLLAAQRVGGSAAMQALTISNTAAAGDFSERLNGSVQASGGALATGAFSLLAAGASSTALSVGVDTATSGAKSGIATISLASDGAGTSGFGSYALAAQQVQVAGNVYAQAVAQLNTPAALNFGIVRVGDVVAVRTVSVSNMASGALTDQLQASVNGLAAPFTVGAAAQVAAGQSGGVAVAFDTSVAGVFNSAASLGFVSHNAEMADLVLGSAGLSASGQVNNLAVAGLSKTGGSGVLSGTGLSYTLNFGSFVLGSGGAVASLALSNGAPTSGPSDDLAGMFDLSALQPGDAFSVFGLGSFSGLAAGGVLNGLSFQFASATAGHFDRVIWLNSFSTNADDPTGRALGAVSVHLEGTVLAAVPEPSSYGLMALGLGVVAIARRRKPRSA